MFVKLAQYFCWAFIFLLPLSYKNKYIMIYSVIILSLLIGMLICFVASVQLMQRRIKREVHLMFLKLDFNKKAYDETKEKLESIRSTFQTYVDQRKSKISYEELIEAWTKENEGRPSTKYIHFHDYLKINFTFNKI